MECYRKRKQCRSLEATLLTFIQLFTQMMSYCQGNCNLEHLALYRELRYNQSKADNGNFFFGPGSLLLYGAASFLYELMPTAGGTADEAVSIPSMISELQR